jgi:hypothetical protein
MTSRKQTPDILAEVLTSDAPEIDMPLAPVPATRKPSAPRAKRPALPKEPKPAPVEPAVEPKVHQYQVASFQNYHGWRVRFIDGKEVKNWERGLLLHEFITCMAEQGWKLASACSGQALYSVADKYQLFFKKST